MIGTAEGARGDRTVMGRVSRAALALEERHLAAWSARVAARERFAHAAAWFLGRQAESRVCVLCGGRARDLAGFCRELQRALPEWGAVTPTIEGRGGVMDRLRRRGDGRGGVWGVVNEYRRYYVWRDADVMLRQDASLFDALATALVTVAAEAEYASEDRLLIHRAVLIGGAALGTWAAEIGGDRGPHAGRVRAYRV